MDLNPLVVKLRVTDLVKRTLSSLLASNGVTDDALQSEFAKQALASTVRDVSSLWRQSHDKPLREKGPYYTREQNFVQNITRDFNRSLAFFRGEEARRVRREAQAAYNLLAANQRNAQRSEQLLAFKKEVDRLFIRGRFSQQLNDDIDNFYNDNANRRFIDSNPAQSQLIDEIYEKLVSNEFLFTNTTERENFFRLVLDDYKNRLVQAETDQTPLDQDWIGEASLFFNDHLADIQESSGMEDLISYALTIQQRLKDDTILLNFTVPYFVSEDVNLNQLPINHRYLAHSEHLDEEDRDFALNIDLSEVFAANVDHAEIIAPSFEQAMPAIMYLYKRIIGSEHDRILNTNRAYKLGCQLFLEYLDWRTRDAPIPFSMMMKRSGNIDTDPYLITTRDIETEEDFEAFLRDTETQVNDKFSGINRGVEFQSDNVGVDGETIPNSGLVLKRFTKLVVNFYPILKFAITGHIGTGDNHPHFVQLQSQYCINVQNTDDNCVPYSVMAQLLLWLRPEIYTKKKLADPSIIISGFKQESFKGKLRLTRFVNKTGVTSDPLTYDEVINEFRDLSYSTIRSHYSNINKNQYYFNGDKVDFAFYSYQKDTLPEFDVDKQKYVTNKVEHKEFSIVPYYIRKDCNFLSKRIIHLCTVQRALISKDDVEQEAFRSIEQHCVLMLNPNYILLPRSHLKDVGKRNTMYTLCLRCCSYLNIPKGQHESGVLRSHLDSGCNSHLEAVVDYRGGFKLFDEFNKCTPCVHTAFYDIESIAQPVNRQVTDKRLVENKQVTLSYSWVLTNFDKQRIDYKHTHINSGHDDNLKEFVKDVSALTKRLQHNRCAVYHDSTEFKQLYKDFKLDLSKATSKHGLNSAQAIQLRSEMMKLREPSFADCSICKRKGNVYGYENSLSDRLDNEAHGYYSYNCGTSTKSSNPSTNIYTTVYNTDIGSYQRKHINTGDEIKLLHQPYDSAVQNGERYFMMDDCKLVKADSFEGVKDGCYRGKDGCRYLLVNRKQYRQHACYNCIHNSMEKIVFYAHNAAKYDMKFLLLSLHELLDKSNNDDEISNINIISKSMEKIAQLSFELNGIKCVFGDSMSHLAGSLDKNVGSNVESCVNGQCKFDEMFTYTLNTFPDLFKHMYDVKDKKVSIRKLPLPYDKLTSFESIDMEVSSLTHGDFYSKLKGCNIDESEFIFFQQICKERNYKTLRDYLVLYNEIDVFLLADIFRNYRKFFLRLHTVDPAHFMTISATSQAGLYKRMREEGDENFKGVELMSDPEMVLMFESAKRGGSCGPFQHVFEREVDKCEAVALDANNLYGWCMLQPLPSDDYQWVDVDTFDLDEAAKTQTAEVFDACTMSNPVKGYLLKVDLEYPAELHARDRNYPAIVVKKSFDKDGNMLSNGDIGRGSNKLIHSLEEVQPNYVLTMYRLNLLLKRGLKVTKIHSVLSFNMRPLLRSYIEVNTRERDIAKDLYGSDSIQASLPKLMNNAVYGKQIENPRNYMDTKIIVGRKKYMFAKSNDYFKSSTWLGGEVWLCNFRRSHVVMDKPIQIGVTILDYAKLKMLENYISLEQYALEHNFDLRMCYSDTDSFYLSVQKLKGYEFNLDDDFIKPLTRSGVIDKKRLGALKYESEGKTINQIVAVSSKCYTVTYQKKDGEIVIDNKAKGVYKSTAKQLTPADYLNVVGKKDASKSGVITTMQSRNLEVYTISQQKTLLSGRDDKMNFNGNIGYAHGYNFNVAGYLE